MATEVKMPRLSLTMESGVLLHWLKEEGDHVAKGEELAEIETDKAGVVMEAPATGYLRRVRVTAGQEVPCDTVLAVLVESADDAAAVLVESADDAAAVLVESADDAAAVTGTDGQSTAVTAADAGASRSGAPDGGRVHVNASPAAKNLARQLGVDLATVTGTSRGGRIGLEDVQRAAGARGQETAAQSEPRRLPLSRMRAAIAQRMVLSATTVPQFTVRRRIDMTGALRLRDAAETARRPGVADVLNLAVARALQAHPEVNASFDAGTSPESSGIVLHAAVNLGIAVALPDGLLVPVIHNAHAMTLDALAAERIRLQDEATRGRLAARALTGATFTVSNLGTMNVDEFAAIINPPEAAILAVGRMQHELVVRDGAIHTLPMMTLTVTADHRVLDGAQVARFLETLAGYLDHPEVLAL